MTRLRGFVEGFSALLDETDQESLILERGRRLLKQLVSQDDWLPEAYAQPSAERYQQYLLHCDGRFSVVSFVWGPGQATPVHDHTVWGLIGMLRGSEIGQSYADGRAGERVRLEPGDIDAVSPTIGDVHRVQNAYSDRTSISIHVYGADIGSVERSTYDANGTPKRFVSGYANTTLPNIWGKPEP